MLRESLIGLQSENARICSCVLFLFSLFACSHAEVVSYPVDTTTQGYWRTAAALEVDSEYGTDGYVVYGLNEADSVYTGTYDMTLANPDTSVSLPAYISGISFAGSTGMWSGNGNFGLIEDPGAGNALTNCPILANGDIPYVFTITRATSKPFRLTIFHATGDGNIVVQTVAVDAGSAGSAVGSDPGGPAAPTINYLVYEIGEGTDPITITMNSDIPHVLTGFAFDSEEAAIPALDPVPSYGFQNALPLTELTWTPSPEAESQKVYFGTESGNLPLLKNLGASDDSCNPTPYPMELGRTYYWRVDTIVVGETVNGGEWKFTTRLPGSLDLNLNGVVDVGDLAMLAQRWLDVNCSQDNWCDGADFDFDDKIAMRDYARLAGEWGTETPQDIVFDFETGDLQGWRITEGAFGLFVCDRDTYHNGGAVYNKQGEYFLSSLEMPDYTPTDSYTGTCDSPVFKLTDPEVSFLVGGGNSSSTYIALYTVDEDLEEELVATASGLNTEVMRRINWNLVDIVGRKVFVRLYDHNTGGWGHITLDDFTARGVFDNQLTSRRWANMPLPVDLDSIRAAVEDLMDTYSADEYSGQVYLDQLDDYAQQLRDLIIGIEEGSATQAELDALVGVIQDFSRQVLIANPLVSGQPILYITRDQYPGDHHNTHTFFPSYDNEMNNGYFRTGGAMKKIDLAAGGAVETLIETPNGIVRDPDVYFDGSKIIFAMRHNVGDTYNIYEIDADGTNLRQLTSAAGVTDLDPIYMPDDSVIFSSTREPKYVHCNRHIQCNLYRMEADGANIHQISKNTLFDFQCSLMPDGRVMYSRWEYVDRNFGDAEAVWACNPDGTKHAHYFGNNTVSPGAILDPRAIPGTHWMIGIFGSCHDRPWGALAIVDRRLGVDLPQPGKPNPVKYIWPESAIDLSGGWDGTKPIPTPYAGTYGFDNHVGVRPKYEDPYPLNDKYFLVSRMTGSGEKMGIYLLDVFGNEILLHEEASGKGCYDPMPLTARVRPPQIPTLRKFTENETGKFYVQDVYHGSHMEGVEPGTAKYLRVVEATTKKTWTNPGWSGQGFEGPGMAWHDFYSKKILGTVPVEEDGSAYFEVPSETFVYFQLLDEDGKMIQSMRSGTYVQPGETQGCVGCHENRTESLPVAKDNSYLPIAAQRNPSQLTGWYGQTKNYNFLDDVQPVFTNKCASCHGFDTVDGAKANLLLEPDKTPYFNTSYNEIWRKGYTGVVGAGKAPIQQAYSWGSHVSRLVGALSDSNHTSVNLSSEDHDRIVTWIDLNAPYYPDYTSAYPSNAAGRSPLSGGQLSSLSSLTGYNFGEKAAPALSFDRPEKSLCLTGLSDSILEQALSIIQTGQNNLLAVPRADMPGHIPCAADQLRLDKWDWRRSIELLNRQAIREGEKSYD